ncbi:hypothetical protein LXL04_016933 [Taraxacum kok-saghyz]
MSLLPFFPILPLPLHLLHHKRTPLTTLAVPPPSATETRHHHQLLLHLPPPKPITTIAAPPCTLAIFAFFYNPKGKIGKKRQRRHFSSNEKNLHFDSFLNLCFNVNLISFQDLHCIKNRISDLNMANSRGPSTTTPRNMMYNGSGRHSLLPPKCPFPTIPPSYSDYLSNPTIPPKGIPKYRDINSHHQRASSESLLIEEQPSWLDELLNEPETPVQRGHRRASSDSFTYLEAANAANSNVEYGVQKDEHKLRNLTNIPSWGSQDFDFYKDGRTTSTPNHLINPNLKSRAWDSLQNRENFGLQRSVSLGASNDLRGIASTIREKQDGGELGPQDLSENGSQDANNERKDSTDTKRAKQQFAQRSRVRKLQYIAELERNVQALQADGSEVSAELEFLNQQSLILSMENKALKQRLENLAQEQLIKCLEQEVLEREVARLQALYHHQQQPPPPSHRRTASRERLDSQFANLSLKNKVSTTSVHNPVSSQQPRT